jgi:hypothetical protein
MRGIVFAMLYIVSKETSGALVEGNVDGDFKEAEKQISSPL